MLINIVVIGVVVFVAWFSIDILAADYVTTLMKEFNILPWETHRFFLVTLHQYLLRSSLIAVLLAGALSFLLIRRVLKPLSQMTDVTSKIASGDYSKRVSVTTRDEISQVAQALNRMADSLQQIEQLRKDMVANVAHELRTPLTNMRGYIEGLTDGVVPAAPENFELLQEETLRLVALVEDLLQLSKADAAMVTFQPAVVDLAELVDTSLDLFRSAINEKSLSIVKHIQKDATFVSADRDKLMQVIHNLVDNATRYTPQGGNIAITTYPRDGAVRIEFANDCTDVSKEDMALIFERFYRGERSRSRKLGGSGIGLSIVRELVEMHGGEVGGDTDSGQVRIWFDLPVRGGELRANAQRPAPNAQHPTPNA
jgi:signal transduction histidine kinase